MLYNLLKPAQFSWVNTLKCVLFTSFVGIPLLLVVQTVPPFSILYTVAHDEGLIPRIVGFVLGVGVLEELCKAMPVYLFLLRPGKLKDPLTAAFYGSVSGLGFAIAEGVNYSFRYAIDLVAGQSNFGLYILSNTIRFVSLPLNHAIWAGIVGYFLGLAAINPSRQGPIIFIGIAICAVLHGLYDTFSGGLIGLVIIAFSILLFVAYLRRSKQMVDEMQKSEADYIASLSKP
ncbi:MAG: PrsW family glutamic-type intramembrane protease [Rhizonema sp. PD38]|nr:PrsW family glutamic-type intramembrane protease [Rhizonema sp. PD38]